MTTALYIVAIVFMFGAAIMESFLAGSIAVLAFSWAMGFAAVGATLMASPLVTIGCLLAFITLGVLFTLFFKWPSFVRYKVQAYKDTGNAGRNIKFRVPRATDNKKRITNWVMFWPVHLLIFAFDDYITKLIEGIVFRLRNTFKGVAVRAAKSALEKEGLEDQLREEDIYL